MTVAACEAEAGTDGVLHLQLNSGTDLVLFNALLTYVAEQGWLDRDFIAASTKGFEEALEANRTSLEEAARITGLRPDDIVKAARLDRRAEGGRQAAPDDVRLREGPDLGQRQLPDQRRPGEPGARHRQRRPARAAAACASAGTRKAMSGLPTPMSAGPRPTSTSS